MNVASRKPVLFMGLSVLVAMVLEIMAWPGMMAYAMPPWVLLVFVYWVMNCPSTLALWWALVLGLLLDILTGALLATHALAFILITSCILALYRQIRVFPLLQQALFMALMTLFYQLIIVVIYVLQGYLPLSLLYWCKPLTTLIIWPCIVLCFQCLDRGVRV